MLTFVYMLRHVDDVTLMMGGVGVEWDVNVHVHVTLMML